MTKAEELINKVAAIIQTKLDGNETGWVELVVHKGEIKKITWKASEHLAK